MWCCIAVDPANPTPPSPSPRELTEAKAWLERAENLGEPGAKFLHGQFLITGKLGEKERSRGEQMLLETGRQCQPFLTIVGNLFWNDQDNRAFYPADEADAKGLAFLRQGAESGSIEAMRQLGDAFFDGNHVPKDPRKALEWKLEAARRGSDAALFTEVGRFYRDVEYPQYRSGTEATRWYTQAVQKGDMRAWSEMGQMYRDGKVVAQDLPEAIKLFRRAAEADDDDSFAQGELGGMYEEGLGLPRDLFQAYFWFLLASHDQGDLDRRVPDMVADMPAAERVRIEAQALTWRKERAERGLPVSQYRLGKVYEKGLGVPPSLSQAYFWYLLAGDGNSEWWQAQCRLGTHLSPAERAEIEAQAAKWKPKK